MNTKEKWIQALGKPSFEIPEGRLTFVKRYECSEFYVEMYIQTNGHDTSQRVFIAIPKNLKKPCPAVAVPFYYAEAMLGFDPETNEKIDKFGSIPLMAHLAERGYITIGSDAYHLTYLNEKPENERFEFWELCADERVDSNRIGIAGHSLGGKMAFYTGCLDDRIKVIIASDFGIGWEQTNWGDIWYWGDCVDTLKNKNMEHSELLSVANGKPFCLMAGQYDNEESLKMIYRAGVYMGQDDKLEFINHKTGHIPPYDVLLKAYEFLEKWL